MDSRHFGLNLYLSMTVVDFLYFPVHPSIVTESLVISSSNSTCSDSSSCISFSSSPTFLKNRDLFSGNPVATNMHEILESLSFMFGMIL